METIVTRAWQQEEGVAMQIAFAKYVILEINKNDVNLQFSTGAFSVTMRMRL